MDEVLRTKPYMMYPLLLGQTVHDPDGIARRQLARIEKYFRNRPRLEEAWGRQLRELHDAKSNPSLELRFPDPYDFARHVENTHTKEIAEQPGA
jgi:hypothetical protein